MSNKTTKPSRTRQKWAGMIRRCHSPSTHNFKHYGGRGIFVCERWRNSFSAFVEDMGEAPEGLTLGRIDNDGPYSPKNCRWETWAEQAKNKRFRKFVPGSLRSRAIAAGLPYMVVYLRIKTLGWPEAIALSTPKENYKPRVKQQTVHV